MSDWQTLNAIARLWQRLQLVVGRGKSTLTRADGPVQMVQVVLSPFEVRDNTLRVAEYGFASHPNPGFDSVCIFVGGDRANGVVIATNDQRVRIDLAQGEVAIHDDLGQKVHLTRDGIRAFSPKSFQYDVNGYGVRTSWDGSKWVIDSYTDTTNVVSNLHPPAPPEIPG